MRVIKEIVKLAKIVTECMVLAELACLPCETCF